MKPSGERRPRGLKRRSSHRVNVVAAIACKGWHIRQAVIGVDLAALWACNLTSIACLEQVVKAGVIGGEPCLNLIQSH